MKALFSYLLITLLSLFSFSTVTSQTATSTLKLNVINSVNADITVTSPSSLEIQSSGTYDTGVTNAGGLSLIFTVNTDDTSVSKVSVHSGNVHKEVEIVDGRAYVQVYLPATTIAYITIS